MLFRSECHVQPLRAPPRRLIIPDISNVLGQLRDASEVTLVEPTPHDLGHFEGQSQDTLVEADGTIAPRNEETTVGRGRGRGSRGRASGGQRGSRRTGSPEVHRLVRDAPVIQRPAGFEDNVPPNFSPMKVRHEGRLHPARFIKYRMYNEPMVWGTMGEGHPVYQQPAHAAPRLCPNKAEPYSHADTFILLSKYPGAQWVNAALINEEDRGLRAKVHRYRALMDEADKVEQQISALQDRMVDISLTGTKLRCCVSWLLVHRMSLPHRPPHHWVVVHSIFDEARGVEATLMTYLHGAKVGGENCPQIWRGVG